MQFNPFSPTAGAVAYWVFIGVVAVVAMLSPYLRQLEVQKTIRKAIEAGESLDPAMLDRLLARTNRTPEAIIGRGLVLTSLGPGLWIIAFCIGLERGRPLYILYGVGAAIALVGLVRTGFGIWLRRERRNEG